MYSLFESVDMMKFEVEFSGHQVPSVSNVVQQNTLPTSKTDVFFLSSLLVAPLSTSRFLNKHCQLIKWAVCFVLSVKVYLFLKHTLLHTALPRSG